MSGEEIDVDELFMEGLSALIASLCAMHPMQLKSALEVVDRALDENVMPTQDTQGRLCGSSASVGWEQPGRQGR